MARRSKSINQSNAAIDHLSTGILSLCYPVSAINIILEQCGCQYKRLRDIPPVVIVFFVISLSLFPDVAYRSVLRALVSGLQWLGNKELSISAKSSLSAARERLGVEPFKRMFELFAKPFANISLRGSYLKDYHIVILDGSTLALQDMVAIAKEFGRASNQHGDGAWPLARFVALAEAGTHIIFNAVLGGYHDSEITLARKLIDSLKPGMLCLADRLFPGFALWKQACKTGCALLWRAKTGLQLEHVKSLMDGSWLAKWHPSEQDKQNANSEPIIVRVIEYKIHSKDCNNEKEGDIYRIITNILEPQDATASELAEMYPQRWEIELTIKETKTIIRKGKVTLRSKTPDMVRQEFYGLLLAHYVIRKMMALAALNNEIDPDRLSYAGCIEIIKMKIAGPPLPSPPQEEI